MYNGKKIRELLKSQGKKMKELREALGCAGNTSVVQTIEGNPTASRLEAVADFFNVSIDTFFIREYKPENIKNEEVYERLLAEKDARIELLEKYIKMLENKVQ